MIDRYTKIVLTIIAMSLIWLCSMFAERTVQAQARASAGALPAGAQPVVIVGWGSVDDQGKIALRYVTANGIRITDTTVPIRAERPLAVELPYTSTNPVPVRMLNSTANPLPVQISSIGKNPGEWEPIRARVEDAPVRRTPGGY